MKLTVLVDNNTLIDRYFYAEPGLSFYIQDGESRILFDAGYSNIFLQNAQKAGIDLAFLDYLVLSHSHLDHTWGLEALIKSFTELRLEKRPYKKPILVTHPQTLTSVTSEALDEVGSLLCRPRLAKHLDLVLSERPVHLTEKLTFLGQIPRKNDFEAMTSFGNKEGETEKDCVIEDSALVYNAERGLVIVTGCSHAGICNIIEYARAVCGRKEILDIVGGLHLLNPGEKQLQGTLAYLNEARPEIVHACHCTDLKARIALSGVVKLEEVGVGMKLEYE